MIIAVDEDVNPHDLDAVVWALSFSMQPHRDLKVLGGKSPALDPSGYPPGASKDERSYPKPQGASSLLIDATRKWPYPPVGLPKKEFMERAMKIWEEEGLPPLKLREPWHGYSLGDWTPEDEEFAELAAQGRFAEIEADVNEILAREWRELCSNPEARARYGAIFERTVEDGFYLDPDRHEAPGAGPNAAYIQSHEEMWQPVDRYLESVGLRLEASFRDLFPASCGRGRTSRG